MSFAGELATAKGGKPVLDFIAYQTAQGRVAEEARSALPESPIRLSEAASHPVRPRASERFRTATATLFRRLADSCDVALPASPQSGRETITHRDAMGCRPALDALDA